MARCKVNGCQQNHEKHYCRICQSTNSDHFASSCPDGTTLYHGTKLEFAQMIRQSGFKPSKDGRLGPGVYFTQDFKAASDIAKGRSQGEPAAVISCRAPKSTLSKMDPKFLATTAIVGSPLLAFGPPGWAAYGVYNAIGLAFTLSCDKKGKKTQMHPKWHTEGEFREYCVKPQYLNRVM